MNLTLDAIDTENESHDGEHLAPRAAVNANTQTPAQQPNAGPQMDVQSGKYWNQWLQSFATWRQSLSKLGEDRR